MVRSPKKGPGLAVSFAVPQGCEGGFPIGYHAQSPTRRQIRVHLERLHPTSEQPFNRFGKALLALKGGRLPFTELFNFQFGQLVLELENSITSIISIIHSFFVFFMFFSPFSLVFVIFRSSTWPFLSILSVYSAVAKASCTASPKCGGPPTEVNQREQVGGKVSLTLSMQK